MLYRPKNVTIDPAVHQRFKQLALKKGINLGVLASKIIEEYVDREQKTGKARP